MRFGRKRLPVRSSGLTRGVFVDKIREVRGLTKSVGVNCVCVNGRTTEWGGEWSVEVWKEI